VLRTRGRWGWRWKMRGRLKRLYGMGGLVAAVMLALAACGSALRPSGDQVSDSGAAESRVPADFRVVLYQGQEELDGSEVQLSELLTAGKPVVLNMWAGLCPPCRLEMPDFQEVHNEFGDSIVLLGLDVGPFTSLGTREDAEALIEELGVTYPFGTTDDAGVVREYGLIGMPTTYFFTPGGEVHRQWTGLLTGEKLAELVEELLEVSELLALGREEP
jgi:thiol-disulfide isomerase/thioredoxin